MKRLVFGVVLAGVLSAATLGAAPRSVSSSSIILNEPGASAGFAAAATWTPHLGDSVSFTVSYPSSLDGVWIHLHCYQNGSMVFGTSGPAATSFLLGGTVSPWRDYLGGAATCRADLYYWSKTGTRMNVLASTEFDAQGW